MITLTFNTKTKTAKITNTEDKNIYEYVNVPTVKVREGFYEVMQKDLSLSEEVQIPICRLPISQTIMFINK
jgi:hypothetical protein